MRHLALASLCGVFATSYMATAALAVDPFFPSLGNNGIDVTNYGIDLDIDPISGVVKGRTALTIKAETRLTSFSLDLHGMNISSVQVNGAAAKFTRTRDKVRIVPGKAIAAAKTFAVTVVYSGKPQALPDPTVSPSKKMYLGWFKTARNSTYVVSEPVGASTFFPSNDEPTDKATYTFRMTIPFGYYGIANGVPVSSYRVGSKVRSVWQMKQPMATWLATVNVNKLNVYSVRTSNGTPVRIYYPKGSPRSHAPGYALAAQMIPYFESLIGPYPFEAYGSVVVEDPALHYALETQAMSTFPSGPIPPSEASVAHELAHQWFGNSVSVAKWKDLWIAEGAATYFEILWPHRNDPASFDKAMYDNYSYVLNAKLGPAVVDTAGQMFSDRAYNRGAATFYALQLTVGDATFYKMLKTLITKYKGKNISTQNFIDTAVAVSGDVTLRPMLQSWIYDAVVPALPTTPGVTSGPAVPVAARKRVVRPNFFGNQCGPGAHRGAPDIC
jgi:aminopeptidase N